VTPESTKPAGWGELIASGQWRNLVLIAFGVWLHAADELMVSTITPVLVESIGGRPYVAWLTALYEIGSIVAGAGSALLVLTFGLNRAMALAAAVYGVGCLLSGFAPSMEPMLAGRLIQGLGGGSMIAIAFVAIYKVLPDRLTARGYALLSVVWGGAAFAGPLIGALFAEAGVWRWAFLFYAIQAAGFSFVALRRLPSAEERIGDRPKFPWRVLMLGAGVVSISQAGVTGSVLSATIWAVFGFILLALFVWRDSLAGNSRMLPSSAWNWARPSGQVVSLVLFLAISTMGLITYGPLLMNRIHGMSAYEAGGVLLLESVAWSIVAIWAAGISDRWERSMIAAGIIIAAAGVALQTWVMTYGPPLAITAGAAMAGGGFGMAFVFMVRRAGRLVGDADRERIASAIPTMQRLGYALGAAFTGIVANAWGFGEEAGLEVARQTSVAIYGLSIVPAIVGLAAMTLFLRRR